MGLIHHSVTRGEERRGEAQERVATRAWDAKRQKQWKNKITERENGAKRNKRNGEWQKIGSPERWGVRCIMINNIIK